LKLWVIDYKYFIHLQHYDQDDQEEAAASSSENQGSIIF
jgi:hypothetical protein